MTDRLAQARAEAGRRFQGLFSPQFEGDLTGMFVQGVVWADANPQPRRVTRAGAAITDDEWKRYQRAPEQGYSHRHYVDAMIRQRLELMGIEVVDDD